MINSPTSKSQSSMNVLYGCVHFIFWLFLTPPGAKTLFISSICRGNRYMTIPTPSYSSSFAQKPAKYMPPNSPPFSQNQREITYGQACMPPLPLSSQIFSPSSHKYRSAHRDSGLVYWEGMHLWYWCCTGRGHALSRKDRVLCICS